jgi:hypothetical protein
LDWGCSRDSLKRYLAAGIRNTLALSDVIMGNYKGAAINFTDAIRVESGRPESMIIQERIRMQIKNMKNINVDQVFAAISEYLQ